MKKKKYFLDQDRSCHWYLVEAKHRKEWDEWNELDADNEESWEVPVFARDIDGPHEIEFYLEENN